VNVNSRCERWIEGGKEDEGEGRIKKQNCYALSKDQNVVTSSMLSPYEGDTTYSRSVGLIKIFSFVGYLFNICQQEISVTVL
jgi:hypothetical protein